MQETGMDAKFFEMDMKMEALRSKTAGFPAKILKDYQDRLDVSWIFHDNALEGVVLSYSELKAAIDQRIISDVTLIPMYEEVRNQKTAVDFVREASVAKKPPTVDLELVRKLYAILTPEIAPPEKITYKMRKLGEWMESDEFTELHPITRSAKVHFRLLSAYPWTKNSGKVARLLMNFILIKHGYLPAVIHSIERQRYYEALRTENDALLNLVIESLENSIETTGKFLDELNGLRVKRAS
jgi:Fic family protein